MDGTQSLAGAAGVGLLLTNLWTSPDRHTLTAGAFNASAPTAATTAAHDVLKRYAGAALAIAAAVVLAGTSPTAGKAVLAVFAALWLLWLILHYGGGAARTVPANTKTG